MRVTRHPGRRPRLRPRDGGVGPRARGHDERGFTMVTVIAVMLCVTLLSIAALAAAQGDLQPGSHDRSRKVAYAAAEAGVQNYLFRLSQNADYWSKCTTGALPNAVNDPWNGVSPAADPRMWLAIPRSKARYAIELLPANGATASRPTGRGHRGQALDHRDVQASEPARLPVPHRQGDAQPGPLRDERPEPRDA
jgi:type II secretory pathway pseudopilin PulG